MKATLRIIMGGLLVIALLTISLSTSIGASVSYPTTDAMTSQGQALQIEKIEVNQGVGVQKENNLKFVAGKPTVIRAFLNEEVTLDTNIENTVAVVSRDGAEAARLAAKSSDRPVKIVEFLCPSMADCGNWAAGSYVFNVKVNAATLSTEGTAYTFQERAKLNVLAVPVKTCIGGEVASVPDDKWKQFDKFTEAVYPVAAGNLVWTTREEFDFSDCSKYDLVNDTAQRAVWEALTNLMPATCQADPKGPGCYDLIVGFINKRIPTPGGGELQGFTYGKPTNIVVETDADAPATVAHEIAHVYGIGDTYNGGSIRCSANPAYTGITGNLWEGETGYAACTETKHAAYDTIVVGETDNMYEIGGRGVLPMMADYMGSAMEMKDAWTSKWVYDWLFDKLPPAPAPATAQADQRLLYYFGYIQPATGTVQRGVWETFEDSIVEDAPAHGPYWIAGLAGDAIVITRTLDVQVSPPASRGSPTHDLAEVPFEGVMPFPAGITRFQIFKNTELLDEVTVSAHAPVVSAVAPATGGSYNGPYTITWSASDADGDDLYYTVEYNADVTKPASPWWALASDLTEMQWADDFSELPGGAHARIRVTASDGILAGRAESVEFQVPFKAPEIYMQEPAWGYDYELGDEVELEVEALDLQDETLADSQIQWSSSIGGALGSGSYIIAGGLAQGEHVITARVTNSAGLSASDAITIRVGNLSSEYIEYVAGSQQVAHLTNSYAGQIASLDAPARAVYTDTVIEYEYLKDIPATAPGGGAYVAGRNFSLRAWVAQGEDWQPADFHSAVPMTLTLSYAALPANVPASSLKIYRWDAAGARWIDAATECAPNSAYNRSVAGQISVGVCHFGEFALLGAQGATMRHAFMPMIKRR